MTMFTASGWHLALLFPFQPIDVLSLSYVHAVEATFGWFIVWMQQWPWEGISALSSERGSTCIPQYYPQKST
jgi:hypothetical protein